MSKVVLTEREQEFKKLKEDIADLIFDSELFSVSDPDGQSVDSILDCIGDNIDVMYKKLGEDLEELETDIYYRSN